MIQSELDPSVKEEMHNMLEILYSASNTETGRAVSLSPNLIGKLLNIAEHKVISLLDNYLFPKGFISVGLSAPCSYYAILEMGVDEFAKYAKKNRGIYVRELEEKLVNIYNQKLDLNKVNAIIMWNEGWRRGIILIYNIDLQPLL